MYRRLFSSISCSVARSCGMINQCKSAPAANAHQQATLFYSIHAAKQDVLKQTKQYREPVLRSLLTALWKTECSCFCYVRCKVVKMSSGVFEQQQAGDYPTSKIRSKATSTESLLIIRFHLNFVEINSFLKKRSEKSKEQLTISAKSCKSRTIE